jgi:hypothetical protein
MAAGAIPPPLFFERRRRVSHLGSSNGILAEHFGNSPASITRLNGRHARSPSIRDRSLSKDI